MTGADQPQMATAPAAVLRRAVKAATAAPSVHNTQPWLFRVRHDAVDVRVDRRRQLRTVDPHAREMFISVGAALFNLQVQLVADGWARRVRLFPDRADPDWVAEVRVTGSTPATPAARVLAQAIGRRHTNRRPFMDRSIPEPVMRELTQAATVQGACLMIAEGPNRDGVLALTRTADNRLRRDPHYRTELAAWTRPGGSPRRDGVPQAAFGPRPRDMALPLRDLTLAQGTPPTIVDFESEPTIALLYTRGDAQVDWLRTGSALQRVWLTATVRGLAATPLTQLTEIRELRRLLESSANDQVVQTVLRLGYPTRPAIATPRRSVADVLLADDHD